MLNVAKPFIRAIVLGPGPRSSPPAAISVGLFNFYSSIVPLWIACMLDYIYT